MRLDIPACPLLLLLPLLLLSIMVMITPGVLFRRSRFVVFFFFLFFIFLAVVVAVAAAVVVAVAPNQTGSVGRGAAAAAAAEERRISHTESCTLLLFSAHFELKTKPKKNKKTNLATHAARFGGDKQESGGLSVNPEPGRKFPLPSDLTRVIFYLLRPEKKKKTFRASHVF